MRTNDFDYKLPAERIAQRPARPRDSARLLVVGKSLDDRIVRDLPELLNTGDLLVLNDTKVIPTRLAGRRGTAKVEVTLHKDLGGSRWLAFAKPAKKLKPEDRIDFPSGLGATVAEKHDGGEVLLAFDRGADALLQYLMSQGGIPLPPYIRKGRGDSDDREDYQTLHAETPGAVAAPTAGLHLTEALTAALGARGVKTARVTLHVGAGTFLPVGTDDPREHAIHSEWGEVTEAAVEAVEAARAAGGRIVACGTTALRLLESASDLNGRLQPFRGETDLYILPGFQFRVVERLLTNFHLPRSTLLMLVAAFAGQARILDAYRHAVDSGYRFYSYGDATLLTREDLL